LLIDTIKLWTNTNGCWIVPAPRIENLKSKCMSRPYKQKFREFCIATVLFKRKINLCLLHQKFESHLLILLKWHWEEKKINKKFIFLLRGLHLVPQFVFLVLAFDHSSNEPLVNLFPAIFLHNHSNWIQLHNVM
jgi:hypothetical protein